MLVDCITVIATVVAAIVSIVLILLSPGARRLWKVLRERCPKNLTLEVMNVMSRMEDVEEAHSIWQDCITITLYLNGLGPRRKVFLVSKHPWAALVIGQVFEDHNWEIKMDGLRARFNPKQHTEGRED